MARCEGLALFGAKVLHCSVRRSCTARCEGLAPLGANGSHASMREGGKTPDDPPVPKITVTYSCSDNNGTIEAKVIYIIFINIIIL